MLVCEPVGLLEGLAHQQILQGAEVNTGLTASGQPTGWIATQQSGFERFGSRVQQHLHQKASCPVVTTAIEGFQPTGQKGKQFLAAALKLVNQGSTLA
jgi:hypothetical protein